MSGNVITCQEQQLIDQKFESLNFDLVSGCWKNLCLFHNVEIALSASRDKHHLPLQHSKSLLESSVLWFFCRG